MQPGLITSLLLPGQASWVQAAETLSNSYRVARQASAAFVGQVPWTSKILLAPAEDPQTAARKAQREKRMRTGL